MPAIVRWFAQLRAVAWAVFFGRLPPHEFAYGAALEDRPALPARLAQFLEMSLLDPAATRIEVSSAADGFRDIGLVGLNKLVARLSASSHELEPLANEIARIAAMCRGNEQAVALVRALSNHQDLLRDEARQDELIVFVHFAVRLPATLSTAERTELLRAVKQYDEPAQFDAVEGERAPSRFFGGNVNIYPLAMDNPSWRDTAAFDPPNEDGHVLEIRFTGLRGIARYLFETFDRRASVHLVHLDGEQV